MKPYPLKFHPLFQERVWGGERLARFLGKRTPPAKRIGESWELSCCGDEISMVANGSYQGMGLDRMVADFGAALIGTDAHPGAFPLLFKYVDAEDLLSVQVHPDDRYAERHEGGELGKTEAWVVVDALPGARLVRGLEPGADAVSFRRAVEVGDLSEMLHWIAVSPGDVIFVPAGQVHAIGSGMLLYEVQQSSDVTYRLYDWGRPRPLHTEKAPEVIRFEKLPDFVEGVSAQEPGGTRTALLRCPYFVMERLDVRLCMENHCDGRCFHVLSVLGGHGHIRWGKGQTMALEPGLTLLLPAQLGAYQVSGAVQAIKTTLPSGG
ncbi:MAG: type I phosphomannose isomerase catalytic subunit [Candidatus Latescibacterota bacterium]